MSQELKFIQIVTGQWKNGNDPAVNHTLYGLTEAGTVYRFMVNDGWVQLKPRSESSGQKSGNTGRHPVPVMGDEDVPF